MRIKKSIADFLRHLKVSRRLSLNTVNCYKGDLEHLSEWLCKENITDVLDITLSSLNGFIGQYECREASTVCRKISSIKSWFRFMELQGVVDRNIALLLEAPHIEQRVADIMTDDETAAVIAASVGFTRDNIMLRLFFSTGIRREELTNIKISDMVGGRILIHGKGGKQRYVYISDELERCVHDYINGRKKKSAYLFLSQYGKQIDVRSVSRIVDKYMTIAGCKKPGRSVHATRKKFATTAYENTGEIYAVSLSLGHVSVETTKRYVAVREEKNKAVFASVNF